MKIYKLSVDSSENGYVYASGYGPLETGMPFLPKSLLDGHKKFWEIDPMAPGLDVEKGRKKAWPDVLLNGFSPPHYFLSECIIHDLELINVRFHRVTEMPIGKIHGKWHQKNTPPKYFVAEAAPGIQINFEASGYKLDQSGNPVLPALYRKAFTKDVFIYDSWTGNDLFSQKYFGIMGSLPTALFCTEKVKKLAEDKGWTNVNFEELQVA
ncbi:MAG: hypothetical protein ACO3N7_00145 [Kiritimatiellia bacterium]